MISDRHATNSGSPRRGVDALPGEAVAGGGRSDGREVELGH